MARALLILDALESEGNEERRQSIAASVRLRRNLRNCSALENLSDTEFRAHYRLTKSLFIELCNEIRPYMTIQRRSTKVSVECRVLAALSFFATGSYQKPIGMSYMHAMSQPSISICVREVTRALNNANVLSRHIKFPQSHEERLAIVRGFSDKFGMPGILGCVDGTHVALIRPTEHEERFYNRKRYHSRNVQLICDADLNILNVDASFGGATHDSYIWRLSEVNNHVQELYRRGESMWLLGDSGYPLRPWLMTPIVNAATNSPEQHYTNVHCLVRNSVERCIGVLKARWRCLLAHRVLHYDHHYVAKIINACCVLQNIANRHRIPVPDLPAADMQHDRVRQEPIQDQVEEPVNEAQELELGRRRRNLIVQRLWRVREN